MGDARRGARHPGAVRVLGVELDETSVAISSLVLSVGGNTYVEAVRVFDGEWARQVVSPDRAQVGRPVVALRAMVSEVVERANAIAFAVAQSSAARDRSTAALSCGPILGLGMALGLPVIPLSHATIAHALVGRRDASRAEFAAALDARIAHRGHELASVHEAQRSMVNAVASAVVGLEELMHWRVPAPSRSLKVMQAA